MGFVYSRPGTSKLWIKFKDEGGAICRKPTEFRIGEETQARRFLGELEDSIAAAKHAGATSGPILLRQYAKTWLERRLKQGIASVGNDRSHLDIYVLPQLGDRRIDQIRARDLVHLFEEIRLKLVGRGEAKHLISPKQVWNVYSTTKALFRDAKLEGLVHEDPAILGEHQLGKLVDRDTMEAAESIYPREHVAQLLASELIDQDRRVFYALEYFARCRLGEAAAICWVHYQPAIGPLGQLIIARSHARATTKSGRVRYMPVHPTLAAALAEWRLAWPTIYGRQPLPTDPIVPYIRKHGAAGHKLATGDRRTRAVVNKRFAEDLARLELPHRRGHDLGSSFITHAVEDGAEPEILSRCTHTGGRKKLGAFEGYLRRNWGSFCSEVAKLKIAQRRSEAEVVPLARASGTPTVPSWAQFSPAKGRESTGGPPEGDLRLD